MGYPIRRGQVAQSMLFLMVDATDHSIGLEGLSPTVTLRKPGGAFGAPAGAVAQVGKGWYEVAGNATDSDTPGPLILHAEAPGADPCDEVYPVVGYDPLDGQRMGLVALPVSGVLAVKPAATLAAADVSGNLPVDKTGYALTSAYDPAKTAAQSGQIPANLNTLVITSGAFAAAALANAPTGSGVTLSQLNAALASGVTTMAASGLDRVVVEPGSQPINARQALALILAASAGGVAGAGTGVIVIKGGNSATTRITAVTDNAGNRNSVTLTLPS